jgi:hypothetical protein
MQDNKAQVVCCRYGLSDLDTVKVAAEIMGQNLSVFTRTASVALANAIIEAAGQLGDTSPGSGDWSRCRIAEGTIEGKENA